MSHDNDRRPVPRYGEYAEADTQPPTGETPGASATPNSAQHSAQQIREPRGPGQADPDAYRPTSATPPSQAASSGRLPGVPHNLGVSGSAANVAPPPTVTPTPPARPSTESSTSGGDGSATENPTPHQQPAQPAQHGEPYRAAGVPGSPSAPPAQEPAPPYYPAASPVHTPPSTQAGTAPKRGADRIITILLLALGALSALNLGFSAMQMPSQLALGAEMFGLSNFVVPQSVSTIGTVGAIIILSLYAVTLIYSIQRLRARKLTFWVPLAAGVISFIVAVALALIAFSQAPELMQAMAQPDAMQQMLDYIEAEGL